MKKILSLTLAVLMVASMIPTVFAAETTDYANGTAVSVVGENDGYTVTVPATMEDGQTGTVTASGAWNNMQVLKVTTPESVAVSYNGQSIDVGITFEGINQRGSDISALNITKDITLEDVSTTFGTWTGVIEYNVEVVELITFSMTTDETRTYVAEEGMTYAKWIKSEYNTDGYTIVNGLMKLTNGTDSYSFEFRNGFVDVNGNAAYTADSAIIEDGKTLTFN